MVTDTLTNHDLFSMWTIMYLCGFRKKLQIRLNGRKSRFLKARKTSHNIFNYADHVQILLWMQWRGSRHILKNYIYIYFLNELCFGSVNTFSVERNKCTHPFVSGVQRVSCIKQKYRYSSWKRVGEVRQPPNTTQTQNNSWGELPVPMPYSESHTASYVAWCIEYSGSWISSVKVALVHH